MEEGIASGEGVYNKLGTKAKREGLIAGVFRSKLLLLTVLAAVDGNLFCLGATGVLIHPANIAAVAITCIGGVGSWIVAAEEYKGGIQGEKRKEFALIFTISSFATIVAASLGATFGLIFDFNVFRYFAGVAVLCIALAVCGVRIPDIPCLNLPLPTLLITVGLVCQIGGVWI